MCPIKPLMMGASPNDIPPAQLFLYLHATASYTVAHQLSTICKSQLRYRKSYQNNLMFCMKFHSLPQCHCTVLVACNLRKLMTRYINFIISLQTKWMMYWIVFALFQAVETLTDIFLAWQYTYLPRVSHYTSYCSLISQFAEALPGDHKRIFYGIKLPGCHGNTCLSSTALYKQLVKSVTQKWL